MTDDVKNSTKDLIAAFGTEEKPVKTGEFMEFWKSLSDKEKDYFRKAPLS